MKLWRLLAYAFCAVQLTMPAMADSAWVRNERKSELTGRVDISWSLVPSKPVLNDYGGPQETYFIIGCINNSTTAVFLTREIFGPERQPIEIPYKIDNGDLEKANGQSTENSMGVGFWSRRAIEFLRKIENASHLVVGLNPYQHSTIEVSFDIDGVSTPIAEVKKSCNWK